MNKIKRNKQETQRWRDGTNITTHFVAVGKLAPHDLPSPLLEPEEVRHRKMVKRSKVIEELVRTEEDYLRDLDLCISEVLTPLRNTQV